MPFVDPPLPPPCPVVRATDAMAACLSAHTAGMPTDLRCSFLAGQVQGRWEGAASADLWLFVAALATVAWLATLVFVAALHWRRLR